MRVSMRVSDEMPPRIVLLVEDDSAHAELATRALTTESCPKRIVHVLDGAAALDYLLRYGQYADPADSPTPDLVLLDLRLPRMDGLEVLQQIRSSDTARCLPVVVLSTSAVERDIGLAYAAGANGYVVKPDDFRQFARLMEDIGTYWLRWNRGVSTAVSSGLPRRSPADPMVDAHDSR